ncbi:MAG: hypothetical protein CMC70_08765 [Flavobacteriaceae bacterium]|nr:hypothetical protein [Flavobacteriaceae bacterium]
MAVLSYQAQFGEIILIDATNDFRNLNGIQYGDLDNDGVLKENNNFLKNIIQRMWLYSMIGKPLLSIT